MKTKKIWQWLKDLDPWTVYTHQFLSKDFKKQTGKKASWATTTVKEVNETYGTFKGIEEKIKGKDNEKLATGWIVAYNLWLGYCGKGDCSRYHGRGFTFDCCLENLKKMNI